MKTRSRDRQRSRLRVRRAAVLVAGGGCALLAGCGGNQSILSTHSRQAHDIAVLWWWMLGIATFFFLGAVALLTIAYLTRRTPGFPIFGRRENAGEALVVVFGIAIPIVVLVSLFGVSNVYLVRHTGAPDPRRTAMTIRVIAHQFWWELHYAGTPVIAANEIHIPVGTPVNVVATSADVIHSFWVPALNRKVDTIPGRQNRVLLDATSPGIFRGQCAQFCGFQHANMALYVFAQPRAAFDAWLRNQSAPARTPPGGDQAALAGEAQFMNDQCASCHRIAGTQAQGFVGPDLTHVASRSSLAAVTIPNTAAQLAAWIRNPQAIKPGNQMPDLGLSKAQIAQLVAYLETLR